MDPEGEQEQDDNRIDSIQQDQEFEHLDPDNMVTLAESDRYEKSFRPIDVRPLQVLREVACRLDFYQKKILEIVIKHTRRLVKARSEHSSPPPAPLVMVDGSAGSGKSRTIDIVREFIQLIMQQPGDDPECPYVLICAPQGSRRPILSK